MKSKKRLYSLALGIFSAVLFVTLVSANPQPNASQALSPLSQELACRVNFNIGVLNSMIAAGNSSNSSSLQNSLATLQNDLAQIQNMSNSTDVQEFMKTQYQSDMRNVISSVQVWRQEKKGMSLDERAALITDYKNLQSDYTACEQQVSRLMIGNRLQDYQQQISNLQNQTSGLQNRGFNVTALNGIITNAQTEIIIPLQNSLSSANSTQDAQSAARTYCLYNGCVNGTNFHLDAQFNLARAKIILDDLQTNAAAFNLDNSTLLQAQQDLSSAQSTLASVGTGVYQPGQEQAIFGNVQSASKLIVQLIRQAMKVPTGGLK